MNDRKLDPIYDALDQQNYRRALILCNKLLKKADGNLLVKSLKALALVRQSDNVEALAVASEIQLQKPFDRIVLHYLVLVYKALLRYEEIVKVYENASELQPKNAEFQAHLFMAYSRVNDFSKMQQTATRLFKMEKSPQYLMWSIVAMLLKYRKDGDEISLKLCVRMMDRFVEDGRLNLVEQLKLYFLVLMESGQYQKAYDVLCGELGKLMPLPQQLLAMKVETLKKGHFYLELVSLCQSSVQKFPTDFELWTDYIDSVSQLKSDEVQASCKQLMQEIDDKSPSRELLMARCLFSYHFCHEDLCQTVVAYFKSYGQKLCFIPDVRIYLTFISSMPLTARATFVSELKLLITEDIVKVDEANRYMAYIKVQSIIGVGLHENYVSRISSYIELYRKWLPLGKDFEQTERQVGDDLLLLAAQELLIASFSASQAIEKRLLLVQCIALLQMGLEHSAYNFQFKLLKIRCFILLGAYRCAYETYKSLEIKSVLHDTVGCFFEQYGVLLGMPQLADVVMNQACSIYRMNDKEIPEQVITAFTQASYTQVPEFLQLYNRLKYSAHGFVLQQEFQRLKIFQTIESSKSVSELMQQLSESLTVLQSRDLDITCDNRDWTVIDDWLENGTCLETNTRPLHFDQQHIERQSWLIAILKAACIKDEAEVLLLCGENCDDPLALLCKELLKPGSEKLQQHEQFRSLFQLQVQFAGFDAFVVVCSAIKQTVILLAMCNMLQKTSPAAKDFKATLKSFVLSIEIQVKELQVKSLEPFKLTSDFEGISFELTEKLGSEVQVDNNAAIGYFLRVLKALKKYL